MIRDARPALRLALVIALLVTAGLMPLRASAAGALTDEEKRLEEALVDRAVTCRIDLPLVRSLYVNPAGDFDEDRYYKRIKKYPGGLVKGDRAKLTRVRINEDHVAICVNRCGVPRMAVGAGSHVIGNKKKIGAMIEVELGRRVEPDDVTPERILRALAKVLDVEGAEALQPSTRPAVAPPAARAASAAAEVELLSVEVEPTEVLAGQGIALVAHFEVRGGPPGRAVPVTEERQIFRGDSPLFSRARTTTADWGSGRHVTRVELTIPAGAPPGVHALEVTLRGAGTEQSKRALFVVK